MVSYNKELYDQFFCLTTAGCDYNGGPHNITIPANENNFTYSIPNIIKNDDVIELTETFNLIIDGESLRDRITLDGDKNRAKVHIVNDEVCK